MKNTLRNLRIFGILCLMLLSCTCLTAQRRGMFRLIPDWDMTLTLERYQQIVSGALASIEQERPKYLNYIDTAVPNDFSGRIYEVDDEEKPYLTPKLPFYDLASGTRYCKVLFLCKAKHSQGFPKGYVATVYVRTDDGVPFCIEWGDSGKELILKYEEAPVLKNTALLPASWIVPQGQAELTEEAKARWVEIARQAVKETLPDVYGQLIPNAIPKLTRFLGYEAEGAARPGFKVFLFGRSLKLEICIWEDTAQAFSVRFDEQ